MHVRSHLRTDNKGKLIPPLFSTPVEGIGQLHQSGASKYFGLHFLEFCSRMGTVTLEI